MKKKGNSNKIKRNWCVFYIYCLQTVLSGSNCSLAKELPSLLPFPQKIEFTNQKFFLKGKINIQHVTNIKGECLTQIKEMLESLDIDYSENGENQAKNIVLQLYNQIPEIRLNNDQGYLLSVENDKVSIAAISGEGIFNAVQTLRQLIINEDSVSFVQGCTVKDWPAFRIRGFMHDTGRSFICIEELKNEIVLLSKYKINTFHWHLTEDLAWRLESKICPMLTDTSLTVRFKGKYYTREQVSDFITFCKEYFVNVIPEIDMPGHSAAFTRATGYKIQSPEGKRIAKNVLAETCALFDVPYFHIGTDEVKITDTTFISEMVKIVHDNGKKVIGWMPGSELGANSIRQMWTGKAKPVSGTTVIDSRFLYLNHCDPFADLAAVYNSNLCDASEGTVELAGAIACVWNDRRLNSEKDIILTNAFYPFMLALAERSWLGGGVPITKNGVRLGLPWDSVYEKFKNFEKRMLIHKKLNFSEQPFPYVRQTNIFWRITEPFANAGNLSCVSPPETICANEYIFDGKTYKTFPVAGAAVYLRHTWGEMIPTVLSSPTMNSTVYAFTYVYSPEEQNIGLWVGFHNYGRSELDATPLEGKWDYKESCLWLNDKQVKPPKWETPGLIPSDKEIPYTNESFEMRSPLAVSLIKGWNKLVLKMPVGDFSDRYTRLVKWMFTVVFVTPDGNDVPNGLIYSPEKKFKSENDLMNSLL